MLGSLDCDPPARRISAFITVVRVSNEGNSGVAEDESVNVARRVNGRLEDQHAQMIVVDYTEWVSEGVACGGETKV
jgi:hypothetical protein